MFTITISTLIRQQDGYIKRCMNSSMIDLLYFTATVAMQWVAMEAGEEKDVQ